MEYTLPALQWSPIPRCSPAVLSLFGQQMLYKNKRHCVAVIYHFT